MDHDRRNLMKGMLTGGSLLALGMPGAAHARYTPPAIGEGRRYALLLGNTTVDAAFAKGVAAACAAQRPVTVSEDHAPRFHTVRLGEGLLSEADSVAALLNVSQGTRWIAFMDDASAAIFTEIVRNAHGRLLARGTHAASAPDSAATENSLPVLRHLWTSASPAFGPGEMLASQLVHDHRSFSIVENFLEETASEVNGTSMSSGSMAGFQSYWLARSDERHLHCSGVALSEGCQLLGWDGNAQWLPFSAEAEAGVGAGHRGARDGQPMDWVETLGFSVAVVALEMGIGKRQVSGARRAFVHGAGQENPAGQREQGSHSRHIAAEARLTSFIIDV